jgi:hypothetical protein
VVEIQRFALEKGSNRESMVGVWWLEDVTLPLIDPI